LLIQVDGILTLFEIFVGNKISYSLQDEHICESNTSSVNTFLSRYCSTNRRAVCTTIVMKLKRRMNDYIWPALNNSGEAGGGGGVDVVRLRVWGRCISVTCQHKQVWNGELIER